MIGIGACVSIQFAALEYAKRLFVFDNVSRGKSKDLSNAQLFLAGSFSGVANSVLSGPIEHIRTRLQIQSGEATFKGPADLIRKLYESHGIAGIFKGQKITVIREFFGYGMYFATYEYLMQKTMQRKDEAPLPRSAVPAYKQMMFGGFSGLSLWMVIYPIVPSIQTSNNTQDVIKSKIQTDGLTPETRKYNGIIDCIKKTYRTNRIPGFYKGFWPCIIRSMPVNGATFVAYELTMNLIGR